MTQNRLITRRGTTTQRDAVLAAAELREQIYQEAPSTTLIFCAPSYDLPSLAEALRDALPGPLIGCTTAGELGPLGYTADSIVAVSIGGEVETHTYEIDLVRCEEDAIRVAAEVSALLKLQPARSAFGLLLVDGLSLSEERLASALYQHLGLVPLVGGSAGDNLAFAQTYVLTGSGFRSAMATFTLFVTNVPFTTFKFEHFEGSDRVAVITAAEAERRIIWEINGAPAAEAYADLVGVDVDQLNDTVFSNNPFVLELDGEVYIRSIVRANADKSMTLFCAIHVGVVLTIGRSVDPICAAKAAFARVHEQMAAPSLIIGCDCILRRLEFEGSDQIGEMGAIMAANSVVGFSTYGEQFNSVHINQTFTGIALGG